MARAAASMVYGKAGAFTGPTLTGCAVSADKKSLTVKFNNTLLADDKIIVQDYSKVRCRCPCATHRTSQGLVELVCGFSLGMVVDVADEYFSDVHPGERGEVLFSKLWWKGRIDLQR